MMTNYGRFGPFTIVKKLLEVFAFIYGRAYSWEGTLDLPEFPT
jgi:hypothetical protein